MNLRIPYVAVFLTSLSTLMLELALTRLFSATMYYHFAFMAISLALFGSGASGVFIYLMPPVLRSGGTEKYMAASAALFSVGNLLALYVIVHNPLTLDFRESIGRLVLIYAGASVPFFFAGCTVTLAVTRYRTNISRVYLCDLVGAAAGCLILVPAIHLFGAINTVLLVSVIASVVAVLFSLLAGVNRSYLAGALVLLGGTIGLVVYNSVTERIEIQAAKGHAERKPLFSKWNSFSRVTVEGDLRGFLQIKIDSDAATDIARGANNPAAISNYRNRIEALAYRLKHDANVLIIGPGGGDDVMAAQAFGMRHITAVEVNSIIACDVMSSEPFKSYSGSVYQQPNVKLVVDEGRSFIRRSPQKYDVIQATMVDTWAATAAGAFALTENNLYTVEAFRDYVEHLTDDGVLTMTRWYLDPPDQLLRLVSLTRVAMADLGITNPPRHILMLADGRVYDGRRPATYLFKRSEFTDDEIELVRTAARGNGFQSLYWPGWSPNNLLAESPFVRLIETPDPSPVWRSSPNNIDPTWDNNPFFFNSVRLANVTSALNGPVEWRKTNLGTLVLFALVFITGTAVIAFIVGPLILARNRDVQAASAGLVAPGVRLAYLAYFLLLGGGFIVVEVAMVQKFILFLGHPVYSLTVVLFSLLLFSGLGSHLSERFKERLAPSLARVIGIIAAAVAGYTIVLSPIFYALVHFPLSLRIIIAVILISPLGIVMGMPMPVGIRLLARDAPEIIPWAWGLNGAASVTGSVGALAIALLAGFNQALLVGASLYLVALFFVTRADIKGHAPANQPHGRKPCGNSGGADLPTQEPAS
jgi:hypothetical protein